ncbi:MAG: hypothetical protein GX683_01495 [Ruminococcaceae bacterium]|nr:hypothetical protein [Oscillospiraceae bacterium]
MKKGATYRVALGGIITAAAIAIMFFGSIIPFATFASPAFAGFCVLYFCLEFNKPTAFAVYLSISVLSVFLVPDKEQALLFVCVFGFYPIVKQLIEAKLKRVLAAIIKLLVFNASVVLLYYAVVRIFSLDIILNELKGYAPWMVALMLLLGNVAFHFYDILLTRVSFLYFAKIRPRLTRGR